MVHTSEEDRWIEPIFTYDDLRAIPDDRNRHEVIDGELIVTPSPTVSHQLAAQRILMALTVQLEGKAFVFTAPVDVIFSKLRVAIPDVLAVDRSRRGHISQRGVEGAPDLIVEILSPSTSKSDRELKSKLYASEGVREYWIADPEACVIEVWRLEDGKYHLQDSYGAGQKVRSSLYEIDLGVDEVFAPLD